MAFSNDEFLHLVKDLPEDIRIRACSDGEILGYLENFCLRAPGCFSSIVAIFPNGLIRSFYQSICAHYPGHERKHSELLESVRATILNRIVQKFGQEELEIHNILTLLELVVPFDISDDLVNSVCASVASTESKQEAMASLLRTLPEISRYPKESDKRVLLEGVHEIWHGKYPVSLKMHSSEWRVVASFLGLTTGLSRDARSTVEQLVDISHSVTLKSPSSLSSALDRSSEAEPGSKFTSSGEHEGKEVPSSLVCGVEILADDKGDGARSEDLEEGGRFSDRHLVDGADIKALRSRVENASDELRGDMWHQDARIFLAAECEDTPRPEDYEEGGRFSING